MSEFQTDGLDASINGPKAIDTIHVNISSFFTGDKYHSFTPHALCIVKHINDQLIGYLEYSSFVYGHEFFHEYCVLHFQKSEQQWRWLASPLNRDQSPAFMVFLSNVHWFVTLHMQLDLDQCQIELNEFEKKEFYLDPVWEHVKKKLALPNEINTEGLKISTTERLIQGTKEILKRFNGIDRPAAAINNPPINASV